MEIGQAYARRSLLVGNVTDVLRSNDWNTIEVVIGSRRKTPVEALDDGHGICHHHSTLNRQLPTDSDQFESQPSSRKRDQESRTVDCRDPERRETIVREQRGQCTILRRGSLRLKREMNRSCSRHSWTIASPPFSRHPSAYQW